MKIMHIAPNAPYNENWGYQENLLPKYQEKLGHEVMLVITDQKHKDGKIVHVPCTDTTQTDGVRVVRRSYTQYHFKLETDLFCKMQINDLLNTWKPDFIFYHGLLSTTVFQVIEYMKQHPDCVLVQDNHLDYQIGYKSRTWKEKLIRSWFRHLNKNSIKRVTRVYGVTPWRKTYAEDYFCIPSNKTDVLIMGADDEKMDLEHRSKIRATVRTELEIKPDEFLIVTGGKLDHDKMTDQLMLACKKCSKVRLLIFGKPEPSFRSEFMQLLSEIPTVLYIGWINADQVYRYFYAADLIIFPGQHSVLWEQACASKTPCLFRRWEGMDHVNNGGNSDFLDNVDQDSIAEKIKSLQFTPRYKAMKAIAESSATDIYLYSRIAKKSLECAKKEKNEK